MARRRLEGRAYIGTRYAHKNTVRVLDSGTSIFLEPLNPQHEAYLVCGPDVGPELDWSQIRGGAGRLAFALCADASGDTTRALETYSYFLAIVVSRLPRPGFIILAEDVRQFMAAVLDRHELTMNVTTDRMLSESARPALAGAR